jgi:hypothetical protein
VRQNYFLIYHKRGFGNLINKNNIIMKKNIKAFNVINFEFNSDKFETYDVMPYLVNCYNKENKDKRPVTFDEFKEFVKSKSMYMYWSRCEYEIILSDWPNQKIHKKIDIHWQIMNNIDIVTNILMENVL